MVFSSVIFLFGFLPLVLLAYHLVSPGATGSGPRLRAGNLLLLCSSLLFYFWGENWLVWIILASTGIDYVCGLLIAGGLGGGGIQTLAEGGTRSRLQRLGLMLSIVSNLAFLGFFKYFNFGIDTFNAMVPAHWRLEDVIRVTLPLGISFYTFQSMSYTIDVYRGRVRATRNLIDFACYVTLFPQLVAGPIVRYSDVARQLVSRVVTRELFASGVRRFIIGLGKKVLIANTVAQASDEIFAMGPDALTAPLAWAGIVCYTLQIYFDFSGYSDMAIGLGRMFGFSFPENFNHPYAARSIQDFWRRWHISLSTWFRDYLYIPLGGSRYGKARTYFALFAVFLLCGLWHGASWTFVVWGLFHGLFLVGERMGLANTLARCPAVVGRVYTLLAVMAGWVLFACADFEHALRYFRALAGLDSPTLGLQLSHYVTQDVMLAIAAGVLFAGPMVPLLAARLLTRRDGSLPPVWAGIRVAVLMSILALSSMALAAGTHNPFIYFRF